MAPAKASRGRPSPSSTTTPHAAGPAFPREPPSNPALNRSAIHRLDLRVGTGNRRGRRGGGSAEHRLGVEVAPAVPAHVDLGGLPDLLVHLGPQPHVAGRTTLALGLDEEDALSAF